MKYYKIVLLSIFMLSMGTVHGQVTSVNYQLAYVDSTGHYNFNIIINDGTATTYPERIQFNAQYSLVFPNTLAFSFVESLMPLESNQFYEGTVPAEYLISSSEDVSNSTYLAIFPSLSPPVAYNNLSAGDTITLFVFDMGGYDPDVRLFDNEVDTVSTNSNYSQVFNLGSPSGEIHDGNSPTTGIPPIISEDPLFEVGTEYASWNRPLYVGEELGVPKTSAILELESTEKGFLPPRLTNEQILAIDNPEEGLMFYSTSEKMSVYYTGSYWRKSDGQVLGVEVGSMNYGGMVIHVSDAGEVLVLDTSLIFNEVTGSWGCQGLDLPTTENLTGPYNLGEMNMGTILSNCNQTATAAFIVNGLSVTQSGVTYNDWHLPSAQDFLLIDDFDFPLMDQNYWLAHQFDAQTAVLGVTNEFGNIIAETDIKFNQARVYAVRTFVLE